MIYISGPITAKTPDQWKANLQAGRDVAIQMAIKGIPFHSPHLNSWGFESEELLKDVSWQNYIDMDLQIIERCTGMLMMDSWEKSRGARVERDHAVAIGLPVYYSVAEVAEHVL